MDTNNREVLKWTSITQSVMGFQLKRLQWMGFRVLFLIVAVLSATTGVGAYVFSPFLGYCLFGDLRFWRYFHLWHRLIGRVYYMTYLSLKGEVAVGIRYFDPPATGPDLSLVKINPDWNHAESCGPCSKCCEKLKCPLLDRQSGKCMSYDSLYWRYFNCGRYPTSAKEIQIYHCPKWVEKGERS